jgi:endoglucanase
MSVGTALLIAGCSAGDGESDDAVETGRAQKAGRTEPFWVNPDRNAVRQVAAYEKDGKKEQADQIRKIAEQPTGEWIRPENPAQEARGYTEAAQKAGRRALLVAYNIPHRDCGQYSQGGAADGNEYRAWIDGVAEGIGDRPATVILEPDAVLHLVDGCTPQESHEERFDLLSGAITELKSLKNTQVYVDAGNAGWLKPDQMVAALKRAGVERADGFSVNVSNFYTTPDSIAYGKQLSDGLDGKPFVIDTGRNGNGPYGEGVPEERWCNPPGRALGESPTTRTADSRVDAYIWAKRPGESDGQCKGGPKAGDWWAEYALGLAQASN